MDQTPRDGLGEIGVTKRWSKHYETPDLIADVKGEQLAIGMGRLWIKPERLQNIGYISRQRISINNKTTMADGVQKGLREIRTKRLRQKTENRKSKSKLSYD
jgi:hypothetical protein